LNERNVNGYSLPAVEADDDAMNGEKQVVIRFLESLSDCVKLSFI
jgi:hypothetical protein